MFIARVSSWGSLAADAADFTLSPEVLFVEVQDGTARLLDLGGQFYALSGISTVMLRETLTHGVSAAAAQVSAQFRADPEQVKADLAAFLADLEAKGVVRRGPAPPPTRPPWASGVLRAVLAGIYRLARSPRTRAWLLLGLAQLSLRLVGWPATVAVWEQSTPKAGKSAPAEGRAAHVRTVDETVRRVTATHLLSTGCKERSLCAWSLLRAAGMPATLLVGIALFPFEGHCWCQSGDQVLGDDPEECERYTVVARYESA